MFFNTADEKACKKSGDLQFPNYEEPRGEQLNRIYSFPKTFHGKQLKAWQNTLSCETILT